ncbi:hypothetical protein C5167_051103 [Papaver somniferum]|uniref:Peroxidase n=1 Tax=Papaver somniferum TaxID=3469 RepID=A0A4Y7KUK3_PAPSO|nr:putative Peroxidase 48 [Papaver somniferum]RZC75619.1 hypothetical protein C5167_051103 [Papaver somniferum]
MLKKWILMLFSVSVILSVITEDSTVISSSSPASSSFWFNSLVGDQTFTFSANQSLEFDFYRNSCPNAEKIIGSTLLQLYNNESTVAPALVRLLFHDCFIMGCDASVLLNSTNGVEAEKDVIPNQSLKGFDVVDKIKSSVESVCPGVVSCSDILVLAARDSVVLSGGPFYPVPTGRRDSLISYPQIAIMELPAPTDDLSVILAKFLHRNFNEQETVSLLGTHSIGVVHCNFLTERMSNFNGTGQPDPSIEPEFLKVMRRKCENNSNSEFIDMKSDGAPETGFGSHFYQSLIRNKSILPSDQQLMSVEKTASWVRAYAANNFLFIKDFSKAMIKLSNNGVLTGLVMGQIRVNCSSTL